MKKLRFLIVLLILMSLTTGLVFADKLVSGDKLAIAKDVVIDKDTSVRGDVLSIFSNIKIDGKVDGEVVAIFGNVEVNGVVDGNVLTVFGSIDMGENSLITEEKVQIIGGNDYRPSSSAVRGEEVTILPFNTNMPGIAILIVVIVVILFLKSLVAFLLSLILVALFPERMDNATSQFGNNVWRKLGIGVLAVVIFYSATSVLGFILVGIPLIPILAILYGLLGFAANTVVKLAIGKRLGRGKDWSNITQLVIGSLIYLLVDITIILKPVLYIAKLIGMGALIDTKIGTVDYWGQNKGSNSLIDPNNTEK